MQRNSEFDSLFISPNDFPETTRSAIFNYFLRNPQLKQINAGLYLNAGVDDFELDHPLQYHGELHQQINSGQLDFLSVLLQPHFVDRYVGKGFHIFPAKTRAGETSHYIAFYSPYGLAVRQDKYGHVVCDVISPNAKGSGTYGSVYPVEGTLKFRRYAEPGIKFESGNNTRLAKLCRQQTELSTLVKGTRSESQLSKYHPPLGSRETFFGTANNDNVAGFSMKNIPKEELYDILSSPSFSNDATLDDQFQLGLSTLKSLKRVHDQGLIHRDIKPENILVDQPRSYYKTSVIDFGLARLMHVQDGQSCGTPAYVPKEIYEKTHQDEKADIFSAGLTLALIFNDQYQYEIASLNVKELLEKREEYDWNIPLNLFYYNHQQNILENIRQSVTDILQDMLSANSAERPTIDKCIAMLETAYEEYRDLCWTPNVLPIIRQARTVAKEARSFLDKYQAKPITDELAVEFIKQFENILVPLHDYTIELMEFNIVFDCELVYQSVSKNTLITPIKNAIRDLLASRKQIDDIHAKFNTLLENKDEQHKPALLEEIRKLDQFRKSMQNVPFDLSNLPKEAQHNRNKHGKLQQILQGFRNRIDKQTPRPK